MFEIPLGYPEHNIESDIELFSSFTGFFFGVIIYETNKRMQVILRTELSSSIVVLGRFIALMYQAMEGISKMDQD